MKLLRAHWRLIATYAVLGASIEPVIAATGFALFGYKLHWPTIVLFMLLGAATGSARRWASLKRRERARQVDAGQSGMI